MKPVLLILAAGMGSRYGSLKQIDGIGPNGETILDYSIFDAYRAGVRKIVFVIRKEFEKEFIEHFIKKYNDKLEIDYVFQEIENGRNKPWGTCHAVLTGQAKIIEPFIVINADDFYGENSYKILFDHLSALPDNSPYFLLPTPYSAAMVGFILKETLSEYGAVSRAVCRIDEAGYLGNIVERFKIIRSEDKIIFSDDNSQKEIDENEIVSLNMWGFTPSIFPELKSLFEVFIRDNHNSKEKEILLPDCINQLIKGNILKVKVLKTGSKWFGLTFKQDKTIVTDNIKKLIAEGKYPHNLII